MSKQLKTKPLTKLEKKEAAYGFNFLIACICGKDKPITRDCVTPKK